MSIPVRLPNNSAWKNQKLVWSGLFVRECKTRFGGNKLGIFWALLQPLTLPLLLGVVFGVLLGNGSTSAMPYPMFVLLGFLPFNLFRGLVTQSMNAFKANQGLLIHQKLKPSDPIFARVFFESLLAFIAFSIFVAVATFYFDAQPSFADSLSILAGFASALMLGTGFGFFAAVAEHKNKNVAHIVNILLQPLLWISCVFVPLNILPDSQQKFLVWNPLVHVTEGMRLSMYPHYSTGDVNLLYSLVIGLIVFWFGMAYYRANLSVLYDLGD
ncbi:MAG: ABC transporter permease [Verrucomicrobiales bacterium]|nr:ABC transporter permease [Verrucomicrobiales bacterium]